MSTELATRIPLPEAIEKVLMQGDLTPLTPEQRISYYKSVCDSVGLNPLTRPLDYIRLNGKLVLYAKKDATDQLRKLHGVSIDDLEDQQIGEVYRVKAHAKDADGRTDKSIGAVSIGGLKGEALANAMMKAETKAKRRVTLSICGLGMLDETEVESIPDARPPEPEKRESPKHVTARDCKELFIHAHSHGHDDNAIREWLGREYGVESTKELLAKDLPAIMERLGDAMPLAPRDIGRAPGAEG